MIVLGIDLAWGEGTDDKPANRSGVAAVDRNGTVIDAGWTIGVDATADWMTRHAGGPVLAFVDAPLVVTNPPKTQRHAEKLVGRHYWREKVAANSTNVASKRLAGVKLLSVLTDRGWHYDDGRGGPPRGSRAVSECYPYTAIVGAEALAYEERPLYKRKPRSLRAADFKPIRASAFDDLVSRLSRLEDPPIDLASHPETRRLVDEPSPIADRDYKRREDLLDAVICAWTARLWLERGTKACQVLGEPDPAGRWSTIIAPYKPHQKAPPPR